MTPAQTQAQTRTALGFRSLHTEVSVDALPLEGALPPWLTGSLLRTGPAQWELGSTRMRHWFDGFAMLHRFAFSGGRVSYANKMLDGFAYRAAKDEGRIVYSEFATDPCRSIFQRVQSLFKPGLSDNANVNLTQLGERFITMTETPLPVEFDPETLQAAGVAYETPGSSPPRTPTATATATRCSTTPPSSGRAAATGSSGWPPARTRPGCSRRCR